MNIYEDKKLENGRGYAAVLTDVIAGYDYVKEIATTDYIYKVYISPLEITEVVDSVKYYRQSRFLGGTVRKVLRLVSKYKHRIAERDYRNEFALANAFKSLIGTKVELKPFNYKGEQKYKVVSTERENSLKIFDLLELKEKILCGKPIYVYNLYRFTKSELNMILEDETIMASSYIDNFLNALEELNGGIK